MDQYQIRPESPVGSVRVDTKELVAGEGSVALTNEQADRVKATGALIEKVKSTESKEKE